MTIHVKPRAQTYGLGKGSCGRAARAGGLASIATAVGLRMSGHTGRGCACGGASAAHVGRAGGNVLVSTFTRTL